MRSILRKQRQQRARKKFIAITATGSLVAGLLVVAGLGIQAANAAPPAPTVSASVARTPILGEDLMVDVTISNPAGTAGVYNLSATVLLPENVTIESTGALGTYTSYAAGETEPGSPANGDTCAGSGFDVAPGGASTGPCAVPQGGRYLVFQNFSDLPATASINAQLVLRPKVDRNDTGDASNGFAVGDAVRVVVNAYTSDAERLIPMFPGSASVGGTDVANATSARGTATAAPKLNALRIEESEPSPESELLRGVHSQSTKQFQFT
jgi:hypothetical protein